ncbi:MAG: phytanoyl-CoA dioxygenase family protein [Pseudomonadota bacterium]
MGILTQAQIQQFNQQGFIALEDVLDIERFIKPVEQEYDVQLRELCDAWSAQGKMPTLPPEATFADRIKASYAAGLDYLQPLDISLPGKNVKPDTPMHTGPATFRLLTAAPLLDVVESLIGPEITSNPIQHVRIKPPMALVRARENRSFITHTAWHQDRAVTLEEADRSRIVTTWLAMTDATLENGCLQVFPESHQGDMLTHCARPQLGIPEELLPAVKPKHVTVRKGGIIVFHPLTIHGAGHNNSEQLRWSFDIRFNVTGDPTGREMFPDFVARSRSDPEQELHDPQAWQQRWLSARERLAYKQPAQGFHRWGDNPEQQSKVPL